MPVCDGCGAEADEAHLRERIERLELSTRFRPVHISVLLIDAAPPLRRADFFYQVGDTHGNCSAAGQAYFHELARVAGQAAGAFERESVLAEFQRRGFFLAFAAECAVESPDVLLSRIRCLAPTLLRRVGTSYKPKYVALISGSTRELIAPLEQAGWRGRLLLDHGSPFMAPTGESQVPPGQSLADRLLASFEENTR
ncbi:MAG TPA: hypothetical protein VEJ67_16690 [Candidatus Cybelea sp.]|nr:hypothetical protein [Candidatus Cybelea sp.]